MNPTNNIAIIGSGPMGLTLAYRFAQAGHSVTVYEADDRIGGMSANFDFAGLTIERFYHFHCLGDRAILSLLEELGMADKMRWADTSMGYWYRNALQDWGTPMSLLKFKGLGLTAKIRYGLHAFLSSKRKNWHNLDNEAALPWLRKWVGKEAYQALWQPLLEHKFHHHKHDVSAAWIWHRIHRLSNSRRSLSKEHLGYIDGGCGTLLDALAEQITALGGSIRLNQRVDEVLSENGRISALRCDDNIIPHDWVISTAPLPFVNAMIPQLDVSRKSAYAQINNMAVVCVLLKLRKAVTPHFWVNTNDAAMDIPGFVEFSNLRSMDDPHQHVVYVPYYLPGDSSMFAENNEFFAQRVRGYLQRINPSLSDDDFITIHVSRYRWAQPISTPRLLQQLPSIKTNIHGLWIADTSYYYPADRGMSESIAFANTLSQQVLACMAE